MIAPWVYVKTVDNVYLQVYDLGIDNQLHDEYIANLEYIIDGAHVPPQLTLPKKVSPEGVAFYRAGLRTSVQDLIDNGYSNYVNFSPTLSRNVNTVKKNQIISYIDPRQITEAILSKKLSHYSSVYNDFTFLITKIVEESNISVSCIGVEGSLVVGVTNEQSDLDLVVYGQENYNKVLRVLPTIAQRYASKIELFQDSQWGNNTIYNARKGYLPFTKEEMVFHESRKMSSGFFKGREFFRKFAFVGLLDEDDSLRQSQDVKFFKGFNFKPLGISTVRGFVSNDIFRAFRPSIYGTMDTIVEDKVCTSASGKIVYIIDYISNFNLMCLSGEQFECRAMVEEIYSNDHFTGTYRLSLNHWDNHLLNGFYLKTII